MFSHFQVGNVIINKNIERIEIPSYCFLIIPLVPCVKNQDIFISPILRVTRYCIHFESCPNILRSSPLGGRLWSSIVFHCAVKILEFEHQEPLVLCNWAAIHFID